MDENQFNQVSSNDQINQLNQINQVSESSSQKGNSDSKLPVIIIVILLIAGGVVAGYYFGTQVGKDNKCVAETANKDEKKDDSNKVSNNESIKEETKEVIKAGTDTNTSGKKVINTHTKNVVLNGSTYEVKIEVLEYKDNKHNQNVYLNGYKFISDLEINRDSSAESGYYTNAIKKQVENLRVIKDSKSEDEYLVFDNYVGTEMGDAFYFVVSADGRLLGSIQSDFSGSGVSIETDTVPTIKNFKKCEAEMCNKKYILYERTFASLEDNYILQLNDTVIKNSLDNCIGDLDSINELKYIVENGILKSSVNKTYKKASGDSIVLSGQCG